MPNGGILTVATVKVFCADDFVAPFGVVSGYFIKIIVADTGVGMDEAIQRKIFNPFFTTRETGKGSGLGLASAFGIVKNHGGFITVKSEPGAGSAVNVYLPVSQTA